jgi:hypothetical protein
VPEVGRRQLVDALLRLPLEPVARHRAHADEDGGGDHATADAQQEL